MIEVQTGIHMVILQKRMKHTQKMLYEATNSFLSDSIIYCGRDMEIHNLVTNMLGMKVENPIPKHDSNTELVNEFANSLMEKTWKICNHLSELSKFNPAMRDTQKFYKFEPISQDEVARIIKGMSTQTCKLDTLHTVLLRIVLLELLPTTTKLSNMSVDLGILSPNGKLQ